MGGGRLSLSGALALSLIVPIVLAYSGISRSLGAHPWWDLNTALIGAPVGCFLGLALLRFNAATRLIAGLALMTLAGFAAAYGKTRFAASYAEDWFPGKLWYFGWIGIAAGLGLTIFAIFGPKPR